MRIVGHVIADNRRCRDLRSAVHCRVPAVKRVVACLGGYRQCPDCRAGFYRRRSRSAGTAVSIPDYRVIYRRRCNIFGKLRIIGHIARHGGRSRYLRSAACSREPSVEMIAVFGCLRQRTDCRTAGHGRSSRSAGTAVGRCIPSHRIDRRQRCAAVAGTGHGTGGRHCQGGARAASGVGHRRLGFRLSRCRITVSRRGNATGIRRQVTCAIHKLAGIRAAVTLEDLIFRIGFPLKSTALEIAFRILRTYIIIRYRTIPIAVQEMQIAVTATHHTLFASVVPPAVGPGDVICSVAWLVGRGRTQQIGETVVSRATGSAGLRGFQVPETAPTNRHIICSRFIIKIAVTAVLKIAVIHPCVCYILETQQIPSIAVIRTGAHKGEVTDDEVAETLDVQYTRSRFVLLQTRQRHARQTHQRHVRAVLHLHTSGKR